MSLIAGFMMLFIVLLTASIVVNAPLILLMLLGRRRLDRRIPQILLTSGFAAATAYFIWRMEWFDMWRHGIPPLAYIIQAFGPYTIAVAAVGWILGFMITPRARHRARVNRRSPNSSAAARSDPTPRSCWPIDDYNPGL